MDFSYQEENHISLKRNCEDTSTLKIESDHLLVLGNLPHNTKISFNPDDARKLRDWLNSTYKIATTASNVKITIDNYFIEIVDGVLKTNLYRKDKFNRIDANAAHYNARIDGVCSMILEAHKIGIDVTPFIQAIEAAIKSFDENVASFMRKN